MGHFDVSVIIPMKNVQNDIEGIIDRIEKDSAGICKELSQMTVKKIIVP